MRMGIDLGGTKIEAVVLDGEGRERFRQRVPTPRGDYQGILRAIADLVRRAEAAAGEGCTVGIGTPGSLSPATGLMKNSNSTVLNGKPLLADLERVLGREVRLANDANCFALSESSDGAGSGFEVVFGAIIGTGCGAGIVVRGEVLTGPNAIASEWGHNPLPWPRDEERPGPPCYCGKHGCIETWLSGTGLARVFAQETGEGLDAPTIVARAEAGDRVCEAALRRYEDRMARSLAHVINILDPHVIVLGGGMSNVRRLYANVPRLWGRYVFSDTVETRLLPPRHGDASGVRGAAWLWPL